MMNYSSLMELLRRSALGDPVSKISVAWDIPQKPDPDRFADEKVR